MSSRSSALWRVPELRPCPRLSHGPWCRQTTVCSSFLCRWASGCPHLGLSRTVLLRSFTYTFLLEPLLSVLLGTYLGAGLLGQAAPLRSTHRTAGCFPRWRRHRLRPRRQCLALPPASAPPRRHLLLPTFSSLPSWRACRPAFLGVNLSLRRSLPLWTGGQAGPHSAVTNRCEHCCTGRTASGSPTLGLLCVTWGEHPSCLSHHPCMRASGQAMVSSALPSDPRGASRQPPDSRGD